MRYPSFLNDFLNIQVKRDSKKASFLSRSCFKVFLLASFIAHAQPEACKKGIKSERETVVHTCVSVQSERSPDYTYEDGGRGRKFVLLLY